jgi:hypothetical protein
MVVQAGKTGKQIPQNQKPKFGAFSYLRVLCVSVVKFLRALFLIVQESISAILASGAVICQERDASIEEIRPFRPATALFREEI